MVRHFDIPGATRNNADELSRKPEPVSRQPIAGVQPTPEDTHDPDAHRARDAGTDSTEVGGPKGPEPTRYGDWDKNGRCIDF